MSAAQSGDEAVVIHMASENPEVGTLLHIS